jgi:hypothetical protein
VRFTPTTMAPIYCFCKPSVLNFLFSWMSSLSKFVSASEESDRGIFIEYESAWV